MTPSSPSMVWERCGFGAGTDWSRSARVRHRSSSAPLELGAARVRRRSANLLSVSAEHLSREGFTSNRAGSPTPKQSRRPSPAIAWSWQLRAVAGNRTPQSSTPNPCCCTPRTTRCATRVGRLMRSIRVRAFLSTEFLWTIGRRYPSDSLRTPNETGREVLLAKAHPRQHSRSTTRRKMRATCRRLPRQEPSIVRCWRPVATPEWRAPAHRGSCARNTIDRGVPLRVDPPTPSRAAPSSRVSQPKMLPTQDAPRVPVGTTGRPDDSALNPAPTNTPDKRYRHRRPHSRGRPSVWLIRSSSRTPSAPDDPSGALTSLTDNVEEACHIRQHFGRGPTGNDTKMRGDLPTLKPHPTNDDFVAQRRKPYIPKRQARLDE